MQSFIIISKKLHFMDVWQGPKYFFETDSSRNSRSLQLKILQTSQENIFDVVCNEACNFIK